MVLINANGMPIDEPSLIPSRICYVGTAGDITTDANLTWDATNKVQTIIGGLLVQNDNANLVLKNTTNETGDGFRDTYLYGKDYLDNELGFIKFSQEGTNTRGKITFHTNYDGAIGQRMVIGAYGHISIGMPNEGEARLWMANVSGGNPCVVDIDTYSAGIWTNEIRLRKSHTNTIGALASTIDGEELGKWRWYGVDSGGNFDAGAMIVATQVGDVGAKVPCRLEFWTSNSTNNLIRLVISEAGNFDFQLGNLTTSGTITGVNVTSGVNPGHTHSIYLTAEADTLATVVARGANAGATINVGAGNTLALASGSITDTTGAISLDNENLLTTGKYRAASNSAVNALLYPAMIEVASDVTYPIASGYTAGINSVCYFNAANYSSAYPSAGMFWNYASGTPGGSDNTYIGVFGGTVISVPSATTKYFADGLQFVVRNDADLVAGGAISTAYTHRGIYVISKMGYAGRTISNKAKCENYGISAAAEMAGTFNSTFLTSKNYGGYFSTVDSITDGTGKLISYGLYIEPCASRTFASGGTLTSYGSWLGTDVPSFFAGKVAFGQTDLNEYIDSDNDGYLDLHATIRTRVTGGLQSDNYFSGDGTQGIDTTFLDTDGNTITIKDGLVTAKVAP